MTQDKNAPPVPSGFVLLSQWSDGIGGCLQILTRQSDPKGQQQKYESLNGAAPVPISELSYASIQRNMAAYMDTTR